VPHRTHNQERQIEPRVWPRRTTGRSPGRGHGRRSGRPQGFRGGSRLQRGRTPGCAGLRPGRRRPRGRGPKGRPAQGVIACVDQRKPQRVRRNMPHRDGEVYEGMDLVCAPARVLGEALEVDDEDRRLPPEPQLLRRRLELQTRRRRR
jgi:hypothetical protein